MTAMSPMLASFHQKDGASIAACISGRMKPMPRNAATSTTANSSRSSASRTILRRRTGRRSWLRRSTRKSVRIAIGPDDVGEALGAAVDIHLDERDRLTCRPRRLLDAVALKLHQPDRFGLWRLQFGQQLLECRTGDNSISVIGHPDASHPAVRLPPS